MATIPVGNYGQVVARPGPGASIPRGDALSPAADRTLQIAGGIVTDMAAEETKRAAALQRAQASLTLASLSNELHDAHDQVARGVMDGSVAPDKARFAFEEVAGKLGGKRLDGFAPDQRDAMLAHVTGVSGSLVRNLDGVVQKRQQSDTAATIDQFGEQAAREGMRSGPNWAADKYSALLDFSGPAAGWSPEQVAAKKQAFRENVTFTFYDAAGTGAFRNGDVNGLTSILAKVSGPQGEAMDPLKRTQLTHQLFGYQQHILAAQQRERDKADRQQEIRESEAVTAINQAIDLSSAGQYMSPEFIKELSATTAGTQQAAATAQLLGSQQLIAGFAARSASQRQAILNAMRADGATRGAGTDPVAFKQLKSLETMDAAAIRAAEDNPWVAAQKYGRIPDAPLANLASPQDAAAVLTARMKMIASVENWASHKVSPLQPQEADQLAAMIRSVPAPQAASLLSTVSQQLGDGDRVARLAKQLNDKDGDLALAMQFASQNTTQGRNLAELVLRGNRALKDNIVVVDKARESGWQASIAKQINDVYLNPEVGEQAKRAAFLIMAAHSSENTPGSASIDKAVQLATGGIIERNGAKLPLPYGMKENEFDKRIRAINHASMISQVGDGYVVVGNTTMPLGDFVKGLPDAQLVNYRNGSYYVRAGSGFVTNSAGKLIVIKVGP